MASGPYFETVRKVLNTYFGSGEFRCMLIGAHSESRDTHEFLSSVRAAEITGTGYTADGKILTPTVVFTGATNLITITFPQVVWTTATVSAQGAVYYKNLGTDSSDELAFINKFGSTVTSTADDFTVPACTVTWDFSDTD